LVNLPKAPILLSAGRQTKLLVVRCQVSFRPTISMSIDDRDGLLVRSGSFGW